MQNECRSCDFSKGRSDLVKNLHKKGLVIENVPWSWNGIFLANELVKISPDLDVDSVCENLVLLDPPWTANGKPDIQGRCAII